MSKSIKLFMLVFAVALFIMSFKNFAIATNQTIEDEEKEASLTIINSEKVNGTDETRLYGDSQFTIYEIEKNIDTVDDALKYTNEKELVGISGYTDENGKAEFKRLNLGRYLVRQTKTHKNAKQKVEDFLIDLPKTSDDGSKLEYDVTVYPKNVTIYGKVTLYEYKENGNPLQGAMWKLMIENDNGDWEEYGNTHEITNEEGKIEYSNLKAGTYMLVEENVPDGYIKNICNSTAFRIDVDNLEQIITQNREKAIIDKNILTESGKKVKNEGVFKKDYISFETESSIPSCIDNMKIYTILDKIDEKLEYQDNSLKVFGIDENGNKVELKNGEFSKRDIYGELEFKFDIERIAEYKKIVITYNAKLKNDVEFGEFSSKARISYTNFIDLYGNAEGEYTSSYNEAKVYTGSVLIYKTDLNNNTLEGASFKISKTEQDAKNGIFIKDENGEDLIAVSDNRGYVIFSGLKFGEDGEKIDEAETKYYITEVKAPEGFKLLGKPYEVKVNKNSQYYNSKSSLHLKNRREFELPMTGGKAPIISSILGISLIISSIFIYIKRKNRNSKKDLDIENRN